MASPRKPKFDKDAAFKKVIGISTADDIIEEKELNIKAETSPQPLPAPDITIDLPTKEIQSNTGKKEFIQKAYYITKEQYQALRIRSATSDDPEEKDMSAIVRAALDHYLKLK